MNNRTLGSAVLMLNCLIFSSAISTDIIAIETDKVTVDTLTEETNPLILKQQVNNSVLFAALEKNDPELLKSTLNGVDINAKNPKTGKTPLYTAINNYYKIAHEEVKKSKYTSKSFIAMIILSSALLVTGKIVAEQDKPYQYAGILTFIAGIAGISKILLMINSNSKFNSKLKKSIKILELISKHQNLMPDQESIDFVVNNLISSNEQSDALKALIQTN